MPGGQRPRETWPLLLSSMGPAHHSWEMASSAVMRWSCSTSISLVTRSLAGDKARERLGMRTSSHCLGVMYGLGGRSRVRQRRLRAGPPHQPFPLPTRWAPPHPPVKYHPNMESQIHSRQPGSCGRGSCRGSHSHLPLPPRRRVGSLKACMRVKGQVHPGRPWAQDPTGLTESLCACPFTHRMYMMTPMAQQSTGRPYRCRPTTSGAANTASTGWSVSGLARPGTTHTHFLG